MRVVDTDVDVALPRLRGIAVPDDQRGRLLPRTSPPAASAASSAASMRSARSPVAVVNVSAMASGTPSRRIMFACTDQPSPMTWPAWIIACVPVWTAMPPAASTMRHLARLATFVGLEKCGEHSHRCIAGPKPLEPERSVRDLGHRLGRDRAVARQHPRHDGPHPEEVRLHRDAELTRPGVAGDDRVRHAAGWVSMTVSSGRSSRSTLYGSSANSTVPAVGVGEEAERSIEVELRFDRHQSM